jgi:hypothetical protein
MALLGLSRVDAAGRSPCVDLAGASKGQERAKAPRSNVNEGDRRICAHCQSRLGSDKEASSSSRSCSRGVLSRLIAFIHPIHSLLRAAVRRSGAGSTCPPRQASSHLTLVLISAYRSPSIDLRSCRRSSTLDWSALRCCARADDVGARARARALLSCACLHLAKPSRDCCHHDAVHTAAGAFSRGALHGGSIQAAGPGDRQQMTGGGGRRF